MAEATPPEITRMEDIPLDNQSIELPVRERIVSASGSAVHAVCINIIHTPSRTNPGCAALVC